MIISSNSRVMGCAFSLLLSVTKQVAVSVHLFLIPQHYKLVKKKHPRSPNSAFENDQDPSKNLKWFSMLLCMWFNRFIMYTFIWV